MEQPAPRRSDVLVKHQPVSEETMQNKATSQPKVQIKHTAKCHKAGHFLWENNYALYASTTQQIDFNPKP